MYFLVTNTDGRYHIMEPLKGKWTGWHSANSSIKSMGMCCTSEPRSLDQFITDKKKAGQSYALLQGSTLKEVLKENPEILL